MICVTLRKPHKCYKPWGEEDPFGDEQSEKIRELQEHGIEIVEVVHTSAHIKDGNENYLKAKVSHGKHQLKL